MSTQVPTPNWPAQIPAQILAQIPAKIPAQIPAKMPHTVKFNPPLVRRNGLTVSAKYSSSWGRTDLDHFGIFFKYVDFNTFFRQAPEPIPEKYQTWLTPTSSDQNTDRQVWHIIEKLEELHTSYYSSPLSDAAERENLANQLSTALFDYLDYISPEEKRVCRTHPRYSFVMCEKSCEAKLDTLILDADTKCILMACRHTPGNKAQLVPQAISAFSRNNMMRSRASDQLDEVLIPFITMRGSTPTFYLFPITQEFVDDVAAGRSPDYETVVLVYEPIPEDSIFASLGLALPESRVPATQAFLAFKKFFLNRKGESAFPIDLELHTVLPGDRIL